MMSYFLIYFSAKTVLDVTFQNDVLFLGVFFVVVVVVVLIKQMLQILKNLQ